jgi:hypothetical protein
VAELNSWGLTLKLICIILTDVSQIIEQRGAIIVILLEVFSKGNQIEGDQRAKRIHLHKIGHLIGEVFKTAC